VVASGVCQSYGAVVTIVDEAADPRTALSVDELPPEPRRHRAVGAILLIVGLVVAGILIILVGSALGADPSGGCGGG
jgi:hypothetical protein